MRGKKASAWKDRQRQQRQDGKERQNKYELPTTSMHLSNSAIEPRVQCCTCTSIASVLALLGYVDIRSISSADGVQLLPQEEGEPASACAGQKTEQDCQAGEEAHAARL